ncbi:hypothetical protein TRAPUB_710 [Trametes pubescens]|uniref:Uncharacterized protein n=1 Tax=Trametes pubescens TaxID=154538 RepID=A0A1M2VL71_TRAPU|nr:hypothetical protein TRAPUB_710 [Trametes pubescens]
MHSCPGVDGHGILGAAVLLFGAFPPDRVAGAERQLKSATDLNIANGSLGAMEVALKCIKSMNMVMLGFSDGPSPVEDPGPKWKHWLLRRFNVGMVCQRRQK